MRAQQAAARRIQNELLALGLRIDVTATNVATVTAEVARATRIAASFASDWLHKATQANSAQAASQVMRSRVGAIAATETAQAFNAERGRDVQRLPLRRVVLYRVWDATLDKRTCPVCSSADGTIVEWREPFPLGTPGDVHPWCRCTETLLREDEVDAGTFTLTPAA